MPSGLWSSMIKGHPLFPWTVKRSLPRSSQRIKMLVMPGGQSGAPVQAENSRKYQFMYIYVLSLAFHRQVHWFPSQAWGHGQVGIGSRIFRRCGTGRSLVPSDVGMERRSRSVWGGPSGMTGHGKTLSKLKGPALSKTRKGATITSKMVSDGCTIAAS